MKNKPIVLFLLFSFLVTSGFGCKGTNTTVKKAMEPVTLTYWRVYDDADAFSEIIAKYKELHSYVTIEYKKLRYEEYEKQLLNALAEDRGPDIFSIPSSWLTEYQTKLAPLPPEISMVYPVVKGGINKEVIPELRTNKSLTIKDLRSKFVEIVYSDMILEKDEEPRIYGLPLYVDTMGLYYNNDLLNNAGITEAPKYWDEKFLQAVKKMTKLNAKGNFIQSGVAMGGYDNIERSTDILSLLMMQNGATMMSEGVTTFHTIPEGSDKKYNPGLEALRFYTDFANPSKDVYCWNSNLANSVDLFAQGSLALMFGYSYHYPIIKEKNPKLNFSVGTMPQIKSTDSRTINYANYWTEVVSAKSKHVNEAWDFVQFATAAEQAESYLKTTKKPTALRALVTKQLDDLEIGPFAEQVLTAQSWYRGKDPRAAEKAFGEMIDLAVKGDLEIDEIITAGAKKVQQTVE